MSDQLTRQPRLHPGVSRRTALRGAAWAAPAVTIVTAAPAFAATSNALVANVTVGSTTPVKYSVQNTKFVAWDLSVRSTNMDLTGLVIQLTYLQSGGGSTAELETVTVRSFPAAASWTATVTKRTMTATATATYTGTIARGVTADIHVEFKGTDNSAGEVSATLMAQDSSGALMPIGTIPATVWDSGREHAH